MTIYLLAAFILSMVCGVVFTPIILDYCKRKKIYDIPNERKIHTYAIPRMGGISFFPSMVLAFAVCLVIITFYADLDHPLTIWSTSFLVGLAIMYFTGIIDDLIGLSATTKFIAQICAATLLPLSGLYINNLYGLFGIYEMPAMVGIPLTIFVIVFIDNAINLIDGIDGLAASVSLLALGGFLVYFCQYGVFTNTYTILAAGMMGALVTFLYFNLFGSVEKNTKIFMGDSGSLSLGFTLGFLSIKSAMDVPYIWPLRPEALLVPLTLLFVPVADVVRVTFYRLFHHQPLFDADKNHIHHKLMRAGLTQHQALVLILVFIITINLLTYVLYHTLSITMILIVNIVMYCMLNIAINLKIKSKK
ncbi:MAG: undecaprenyl/decaprenyl-phosphate alpha-N-acetylglucosaminyl 1-phosphate transferase [Prevotella sp.]|nr:undecaprenyl/decaprenyl-phosphate alpha-N-acetylglucosaminyl 1-phosphate transferase [Prevotella sp.]